ncbi:hypothetical protein TNCV_5042371 [Trichonephila clavipes]|nr:hypothetical protein TNCV_5042371 [Trichonephila clavipes]
MPCCCLQEKEFLGVPLTPPKRVTRFPRLEEGNVPINTSWYGMFLGISRVLGESSTARGYPSADSRPIRKADCVSKKNPLQNTEVTEIQQNFSDGFSFPTPCFLFLRYGAVAMRLETHKFYWFENVGRGLGVVAKRIWKCWNRIKCEFFCCCFTTR